MSNKPISANKISLKSSWNYSRPPSPSNSQSDKLSWAVDCIQAPSIMSSSWRNQVSLNCSLSGSSRVLSNWTKTNKNSISRTTSQNNTACSGPPPNYKPNYTHPPSTENWLDCWTSGLFSLWVECVIGSKSTFPRMEINTNSLCWLLSRFLEPHKYSSCILSSSNPSLSSSISMQLSRYLSSPPASCSTLRSL